MECRAVSTALQPCLARNNMKKFGKSHVNMAGLNDTKPNNLSRVSIGRISLRCKCWRIFPTQRRIFRTHVSLEEFSTINSMDFFKGNESDPGISSDEAIERPPSSEELKALLADSERSKLLKKLSEANQQNRFLKRELLVKEDALVNFKSELAMIELEIQSLVGLAGEIANFVIPDGSRKINGKYIQSHLLSRLEAVQEKLEKQIEDVDAAQSQEVPLYWHGVAESVQVMGSFDGWSEGEHLSPEYTGSYTTFSTTLILRRGRYEIKFLVDGEWKLSPEYPTVGEGLMLNNLLIVE